MPRRSDRGIGSDTVKKDDDYPLLRKYYRQMGSYQYYIEDKLQEARDDNAPQNAVHKDYTTGDWVTPDSPHIKNPDLYRHLGLPVPERLHFGADIHVKKYWDNSAERNTFVDQVSDYLRDVWGLTAEDFYIRTKNNNG